MSVLEIKNLHVSIEDKEILKGVNLTINTGEIHAIMGPNGTGKSTLSAAIMGNPNYEVTEGEILLDGENILELEVDERARLGLFLAMQYPSEIQGITNAEFMRAAINAKRDEDDKISVMQFIKKLDEKMALLNMAEEMAERYLNEGFSGGEKKRNEIMQMRLLNPKFALLDEIDSGLDIDALRVVGNTLNKAIEETNVGLLVISHYGRFYDLVQPTHVNVLINGKIVKSGDKALADRIDSDGYEWIADELGITILEEKAEEKEVILLESCAVGDKRNA